MTSASEPRTNVGKTGTGLLARSLNAHTEASLVRPPFEIADTKVNS